MRLGQRNQRLGRRSVLDLPHLFSVFRKMPKVQINWMVLMSKLRRNQDVTQTLRHLIDVTVSDQHIIITVVDVLIVLLPVSSRCWALEGSLRLFGRSCWALHALHGLLVRLAVHWLYVSGLIQDTTESDQCGLQYIV